MGKSSINGHFPYRTVTLPKGSPSLTWFNRRNRHSQQDEFVAVTTRRHRSLRGFELTQRAIWLVVEPTPPKNDGLRQLGSWHSQDMENKIHVPNHQPDDGVLLGFPRYYPAPPAPPGKKPRHFGLNCGGGAIFRFLRISEGLSQAQDGSRLSFDAFFPHLPGEGC